MINILVDRCSSVLNKITTVLDLLGITVSDIDSMARAFDKNSHNKHGVSLLTFLLSCVQYGCGEYYHYTKFQFSKETLSDIKEGKINEVVVPYKLANNTNLSRKELLKIDNELFFIDPTSRKVIKDGVKYGKIYLVSKYKKTDIVYNWFNYDTVIEGRIDTLLNVECYNRHYLVK